MATYLIGDVHGCYRELRQLLNQVNFDANQDTLWLTGDLVARGPDSLEVLRFVKSLGSALKLVLGNHDLHLLGYLQRLVVINPKISLMNYSMHQMLMN